MNTLKPIRNEKARKAWAKTKGKCQACWKSWREAEHEVMNLTVHHLIKSHRSDEPCNFLLLCCRCHGLAEGLTYASMEKCCRG